MARPNPAETVLKLFGVIGVLAILCAGLALPYVGGLGIVVGKQAAKFLDTRCNLVETPPPLKTTIYAGDGTTELATLFTQDREAVKLSQVPKFLQRALIDTEDRRFYSHHGVDMRGLIRSAVSSSGGSTQGGSTLTMQYVKQVRYYQADTDAERQAAVTQTLSRKMEDAQCALDIEKRESKDQILDNYLNIAFFGENSYGVEVAARNYFGKKASQLTPPESALLVGLVKAPSEYDPYVHLDAAIARRNQVLQNMVGEGDLSQAEANKYKATHPSLATTSQPVVRQGCASTYAAVLNAGFFCDYLVNWLETQGGISDTQINTGGLKIISTLDPSLQNSVQQSLYDQLPASSKTTAIMPIVDPKSGNVLAMATSKRYGLRNDGLHTTIPVFTNASAGGGSTFKLFTMLAALKVGVPTSWPLSNNTDPTYSTQHCAQFTANNDTEGKGFTRTETMASAMAKSANTYFVALEDQLFEGCDLHPIVNTAVDLGMTSLTAKDPNARKGTIAQNIVDESQATFTLGFAPTSPLQLTSAYATLANDGNFCPPAPVKSITGPNHKDLSFNRKPCSPKLTPQVARTALNVLTGDTHAPGTSAQQFQALYGADPAINVAGKTGTVNASDSHGNALTTNADIWFVGVTPSLVGTTALFNIDNPIKPLTGIPNMSDDLAGHLTGAFAAGVWTQALAPHLQTQSWTWPDPNAIDGAVPVPSVIGQTTDDAKAQLTQAGFKPVPYPIFCGSNVPYGAIAFQSATVAPPGSQITLCISNSQTPYIYTPPPPKPPSHTPKPPSRGAPLPTRSRRGPGGG